MAPLVADRAAGAAARHRLKALIFGVDGTLADTERDGHLPACNDAFAALGLPVRWTWQEFRGLLAIPGNAGRMRLALERHTTLGPSDRDRVLAELVRLKQTIYIQSYLPGLQLRPGVERLVQQARRAGLRLAIVSTSREDQIHALLQARLPAAYSDFDPILGQHAGLKTAPDSPLFRRCLALLHERHRITAADVLVIEDSEPGLRAARTAGLACAVFYNDYTFGQPFAGAQLVARSLEGFDLALLTRLCAPLGSES